ncbi:MAG: peptidoglycan editing factor PgeF [Luteimonas sp.]
MRLPRDGNPVANDTATPPSRARIDTNEVLHADWPAPPGVHAFTTLRRGPGVSLPPFDRCNLGNARAAGGDDPQAVARNRALLVERHALPSPPQWLRQVHGVDVLRLDDPAIANEPDADAAVTSTPGAVLAILSADCLPVVFAARDGREVAVAHAGWRGLADGVLERTVAAMRAPPGDIVAWLGPAAGAQAYEIGAEVRDAFVLRDARAASAFVATRDGHWRIDLYAIARQRLHDAGVTDVHGGGLCTISDAQRFYSYRRDGRSGRMATLAWIDA